MGSIPTVDVLYMCKFFVRETVLNAEYVRQLYKNNTTKIRLYIDILVGNLGGNRYRDGKSENDREGVVCLSARVFKKLSFYTGWVARSHISLIS